VELRDTSEVCHVRFSKSTFHHQAPFDRVARAVISIALVEDYRAPLQANLAGEYLQVRNSLMEGVGAVFSSVALFVGALFEFGLPLLFWFALLFLPIRLVWRRFRHAPIAIPVAE
jgi:hypothetical protein